MNSESVTQLIKKKFSSRLQKWFTNCKLIMYRQNLPKLWCQYEFIVHNHLWNSEIALHWIQQKISNGLSKTTLELKKWKQQLFTLTMWLPACLWAQIAKTLFNYTAQTRLVKCDDYRFQRLVLQFPALGKNTVSQACSS